MPRIVRRKIWNLPQRNSDLERQLAESANIGPVTASVLASRGVVTAEQALSQLSGRGEMLHDPFGIPDMERAVDRIRQAIQTQERVLIYGDYDVDGITATAILWHVLTLAGASVDYYVPSRFDEGYGLSNEALEKIAERGGELVVSVDCGITAITEVAHARQLGLRMIITDHHAPRPDLPDAEAVVHPTACGQACPNPDLSGAGVALKVAWAIAQALSGQERVAEKFRDFLLEATALAALGEIGRAHV